MENVKSLLQKKISHEFNEWIIFLNSLGYNSSYKVLNSQHYGSSQNRERVIMISTLEKKDFIWHDEVKNSKKLEDIFVNAFHNEENLSYGNKCN